MNKNELKDGLFVKVLNISNDKTTTYMVSNRWLVGLNESYALDCFNDNLKYKELEIIRAYEITDTNNYSLNDLFSDNDLNIEYNVLYDKYEIPELKTGMVVVFKDNRLGLVSEDYILKHDMYEWDMVYKDDIDILESISLVGTISDWENKDIVGEIKDGKMGTLDGLKVVWSGKW